MKKFSITILFSFGIILISLATLTMTASSGDNDLSARLKGRILLQVESFGEAWYLSPIYKKKYYLGRPADAFEIMNILGGGISNSDLDKIPVGIIDYDDEDNDSDGLANRFESALGTDPELADTDGDGYSDKLELKNGYSPLSTDTLPIDQGFINNNLGKIFLQVEKSGEAWYVSPADEKRYYLGRPADAFRIMSKLGLGVSNADLDSISTGEIKTEPDPEPDPQPIPIPLPKLNSADSLIQSAASAIRGGDIESIKTYFIPEVQHGVELCLNYYDDGGRLMLGNLLGSASLTESSGDIKRYSADSFFSMFGEKVPVHFYVQKQEDGSWLLTNI